MLESMSFTYQDFTKIFEEFQERQKLLGNVKIVVKGGENKLPAKTLLRYYQTPRDIEMATNLATDMFMNKEISFLYMTPDGQEREIHHFVFGGGDITAKFDEAPWLLDMLLDFAQGILIKKLTPPSFGSGTRESGSAE